MNRGIPESRDTPDLRLGGMNMYDIEKRCSATNITVGDFANIYWSMCLQMQYFM